MEQEYDNLMDINMDNDNGPVVEITEDDDGSAEQAIRDYSREEFAIIRERNENTN